MLWTSVAVAEHVIYGLPFVQRAVEWAVLSVLLHYSYPFLQWVWIGQCSFCGVHSWQNGTRCTGDGVNYCGIIPIQLGCFLRVSYLHALVFSPKTLLWLVSVGFFLVRKERWEGRPWGKCMVCKAWKYTNFLFIVNSNAFMWNCKSNLASFPGLPCFLFFCFFLFAFSIVQEDTAKNREGLISCIAWMMSGGCKVDVERRGPTTEKNALDHLFKCSTTALDWRH